MQLFTQASQYTLDSSLKKVLTLCAQGSYPSQFRVHNDQIVTVKGNKYDIGTDPMYLCNLVHDILNGVERVSSFISPVESSRSTNKSGIPDDAIYAYARKQATLLGKSYGYIERLQSCIFTAINLGDITINDFLMNGHNIDSIRGIDVIKVAIIKRN